MADRTKVPAIADSDAQRPPHHAQHQRFDQELEQNVAALRTHGDSDSDLPRPSVTETSMMFMIPIPPTIREIEAIAPRR